MVSDVNLHPYTACMWMLSVNYIDNMIPVARVVFDGGATKGLGEIDIHGFSLLLDAAEPNGGFLYAITGNGLSVNTRIVKVEIGGDNTAANCITGCFRRVASYLAATPVRAFVYAPDIAAILTASMTDTTTVVRRAAVQQVVD